MRTTRKHCRDDEDGACRCAGAKAARESAGKSDFEAVMVDPMNAVGEPPAEPQAAAVAAQPEGEKTE